MFLYDKTFISIKFQLTCFPPQPEAQLEPSRTSTMERSRKLHRRCSTGFELRLCSTSSLPDLTQQKLYNNNIKCEIMFKVNNKDNRTTPLASFLVSLLLASNIFQTLLQCFYCLLLTCNCRLWLEFRVMLFMRVKNVWT